MRTSNIVIALFLLVFDGIYAALIYRLPNRNLEHTLGAAFMPWLLCGFLLLLALLLLIDGLFRRPAPEERKSRLEPRELAGIAGLLVLFGMYIAFINILGFLIASVLFLAALIFVSGSRKPIEIAFFSIATTAAVYLLFDKFFNIQLPSGMLF